MICNFLENDEQFLKAFDAISESDFYKGLTPELGYQHKIGHIQKVMLFSKIIAQNENLDERQTKILLVSAAFHDCGRIKDRDNGEHGELSAKIVGEYFKENLNNPYGITQNEIGIIQAVIAYHVVNEDIVGQVDDKKLRDLCYKYGVYDLENFENIKQISAILKDSDALDRSRFSSKVSSINSLDSNLLRTKTAKNELIIEFARKINQAYAGYVLKENYPDELVVENDNAKTLQLLRHNYKVKNRGIRKEEKDIPIKIVKLLFKYGLKNMKIEEIENLDFNKIEEDILEL